MLQKSKSFLVNFLGFFGNHFAVVFLSVLVAFLTGIVECFILVHIKIYFKRGGYFRFLLFYLVKYWI